MKEAEEDTDAHSCGAVAMDAIPRASNRAEL